MIIGITGKIAAGKSEALKILKRRGFYCIDADKVVHDLYKNGQKGQALVKKYFGDQCLLANGDVDREKLAKLVFQSRPKLLLLNRLIHPCVGEVIKELIEREKDNYKNIAVEAVYFDERYLLGIVDKVLLVERDFNKAKAVLRDERGLPEDIGQKIYDSVKTPKKVHFVVKNNGSIEDLEKELLKIS